MTRSGLHSFSFTRQVPFSLLPHGLCRLGEALARADGPAEPVEQDAPAEGEVEIAEDEHGPGGIGPKASPLLPPDGRRTGGSGRVRRSGMGPVADAEARPRERRSPHAG